MWSFLQKIFGSRNQRVLKRLGKVVAKINQLEPALQECTDSALQAKAAEYRRLLSAGHKTPDELLPEVFALVREASVRTMGMRHFDVQLVGGMVLHHGKIAEMRTGEGKTLVATLPTVLNALTGKGVHIITVNDYLAARDANWMRPIYEFLGLTVGVVVHGMDYDAKRAAYACDITYGTNNEFGFDYMRDNMAFSLAEKVQRQLNFAIVDEVDSILIDEARTPLIISGASEESSDLYKKINLLIPRLTRREGDEKDSELPGDYYLDEKAKQAYLTEAGHERIESLLVEEGLLDEGSSLYAASNIALFHHITAALRAHALYHRDVDYIVKGGEVVIVDEHTGRIMPGRRWSDGLHQAVEAKERVAIQNENQTLATITFQNYFRLYNKLAGMTGTADTEAYEFQQIYGLEVVVIPTNKTMQRKDLPDLVFLKAEDKYKAIIEEVKAIIAKGCPVLVGTASIETSELLSQLMAQADITPLVLNAKFHEQEAKIIAQAGLPGTVTIATNMAGRGTDIVLGGNLEAELANLPEDAPAREIARCKEEWQIRHDAVIAAGGLHIIGSERHESRRIDNQLRGRSGRQGDPGQSRFYLSLEDNLIRIFASDRMTAIMQRFGMEEGVALESAMLTRAIENAQRKVEGRNFDIRKQLLEYDDVANEQRKAIYQQRDELLSAAHISDTIKTMQYDAVGAVITQFIPQESLEAQWDIAGLTQQIQTDFGLDLPIATWLEEDESLHEETLRQRLLASVLDAYEAKVKLVGEEIMQEFEKSVMLQILDSHWKDHLAAMDYLRQGIHLRGYAQKNPKQEYKRESFELFSQMLDSIKLEVTSILARVEIQAQEDVDAAEAARRNAMASQLDYQHDAMSSYGDVTELTEFSADPAGGFDKQATFVRDTPKVGRNEACPCGSGKKFKACHGRLA